MQDENGRRLSERLNKLVSEILSKNSIARPIPADEELARAGLTSIDMVNLMLRIEAEFDIMIAPPDITPANFRTIAAIEAMIVAIIARGP